MPAIRRHHSTRSQKTKALVPGYEVLEKLSDGVGGQCDIINKVKSRSGTVYVEKRIRLKRQGEVKRADAEIDALKQLTGHPNINKIRDYERGCLGGACSIILEFCDRGTLHDLIDSWIRDQHRFTEPFAWHVLEGVGMALSYMHNGVKSASEKPDPLWDSICHLDLKPDNIFLSSATSGRYPRVVVGDFGGAMNLKSFRRAGSNLRGKVVYTPGWEPPEAARYASYGKHTDVWQTGAIIHSLCLVCMKPSVSKLDTGKSVVGDEYSSDLEAVVLACTKFDFKRRANIAEVMAMVRRDARK